MVSRFPSVILSYAGKQIIYNAAYGVYIMVIMRGEYKLYIHNEVHMYAYVCVCCVCVRVRVCVCVCVCGCVLCVCTCGGLGGAYVYVCVRACMRVSCRSDVRLL